MTPRSPSDALGTFLPVYGSAGLPIASICGPAPGTDRAIDATFETWNATVSGMTEYWSAAMTELRTPANMAIDRLRW